MLRRLVILALVALVLGLAAFWALTIPATVDAAALAPHQPDLDNGQEMTAALDRLRHIDHGYASTSHSAQGATVDRVIVDIDTQLSRELVNRKQFYVSISRARTSISIYTDDRHSLSHAVSRSREKSLALEHSPAAPHRRFVVLQEQHRSISRGHGLRR